MRGNSSRTVTLESVQVDRGDLLGREGDEIWYVFQVIVPFFLTAMAGTYLGIAHSAIDDAREHLSRRTHSHAGAALAQSTVLQHRLGALYGRAQAARALVYEAARLGDEGSGEALPSLFSAKAEVAEVAERVTAEAMTLLGGRGYGGEHPIQRKYRDVRAAHVMAPTTDILRTWTGRLLLGLPILAE